MASEGDTETRGILTTAPQQRSSTLRTYSRKKPSNKLPSLKPSPKQFPVKPLQQVQMNLRVAKRASDLSKPAETPSSSRIDVVIPEDPSFDPHDYDDAYVGGDEEEAVGGNGVGEEDESDSDESVLNINIKRNKGHTAFITPRAGTNVYNIPDDEPEDSEVTQENDAQAVIPDSGGQNETHSQVVIPSTTPRFTQHMTRGRPPGNGPRRPHLIFNKIPTRNRFKKLPKKSGSQRHTSALRSHPGDGFADDELKRSGLVLPICRRKQTTSDAHVGELDISRAPPLPKYRGDKRKTNLGENSFDFKPKKKMKHSQGQAIAIPDDNQPDQDSSSSAKDTIAVGRNPDIPRRTSQSILHLRGHQLSRSTPPRTVPTQILIPSLRQSPQSRSNLPHRVVIHPPTSEEDDSEDDSTYAPDDETVIPKSNDLVVPTSESGNQQDSSGNETYISATSTGGQRSSSVPIEKSGKDGTVENADAGVQVTQGLAKRQGLKRRTTQ